MLRLWRLRQCASGQTCTTLHWVAALANLLLDALQTLARSAWQREAFGSWKERGIGVWEGLSDLPHFWYPEGSDTSNPCLLFSCPCVQLVPSLRPTSLKAALCKSGLVMQLSAKLQDGQIEGSRPACLFNLRSIQISIGWSSVPFRQSWRCLYFFLLTGASDRMSVEWEGSRWYQDFNVAS